MAGASVLTQFLSLADDVTRVVLGAVTLVVTGRTATTEGGSDAISAQGQRLII